MTPTWAQRGEALWRDCIVSPDVFTSMVERLGDWSCTCILRVIPNARESGTIPPFPICVRGHCHAIQPRFLPAWADRPDMGVPDALRAVAIGTRLQLDRRHSRQSRHPISARATPNPLSARPISRPATPVKRESSLTVSRPAPRPR
jgi:hypothetical protein